MTCRSPPRPTCWTTGERLSSCGMQAGIAGKDRGAYTRADMPTTGFHSPASTQPPPPHTTKHGMHVSFFVCAVTRLSTRRRRPHASRTCFTPCWTASIDPRSLRHPAPRRCRVGSLPSRHPPRPCPLSPPLLPAQQRPPYGPVPAVGGEAGPAHPRLPGGAAGMYVACGLFERREGEASSWWWVVSEF